MEQKVGRDDVGEPSFPAPPPPRKKQNKTKIHILGVIVIDCN